MRILLSGGGTGGHVYPILTVVAALKALWPESSAEPLEFLYVGTADGVEAKLARRAQLDFASISAGQIRIWAGHVSASKATSEMIDRAIKQLKELGRQADDHGLGFDGALCPGAFPS